MMVLPNTGSKRTYDQISEYSNASKYEVNSQEENKVRSLKKAGKNIDNKEIQVESTDDDISGLSYDSSTSQSLGRRGDPRMHRAVIARLHNPDMSLLDALLTGGFEFPNLDSPGKSDRNIIDKDNVLLCQRKNQLSRRLRLARKRQATNNNRVSEVLKKDFESENKLQKDSSKVLTQMPLTSSFNSSVIPSISANLNNNMNAPTSKQSFMQMLFSHPQSVGQRKKQLESTLMSNGNNSDQQQNSFTPNLDLISDVMKNLSSKQSLSSYLHSSGLGASSSVAPTQALFGEHQILQGFNLPTSLGLSPATTDFSFTRPQEKQRHDFVGSNFHGTAPTNFERQLEITSTSLGIPQEQLSAILYASSNGNNNMNRPFFYEEKFSPDFNNSNLSANLPSLDYESKLKLALSIYDEELPLLMKKCLLLVGFDLSFPEDTKKTLDDFMTLVRKRVS